MKALERRYMQMRLDGYSREAILSSFKEEQRAALSSYMDRVDTAVASRLSRLKELTNSWGKDLREAKIGVEEIASLGPLEKRMKKLARDTLLLQENLRKAQKELEEEETARRAAMLELRKIQSKPKRDYTPDPGWFHVREGGHHGGAGLQGR